MDLLAVDLLEPHDEHRTVRFLEDGRPHLDDVVGPDGEKEPIERGVMQLAQRDAVADDRLALGVAVGRDVRCVQEFPMPESTERASLGVRSNHPLAEGDLVQPTAERRGHIRTPGLGHVLSGDQRTQGIALSRVEVVDLHREAELLRMVLDDEDRVGRDVTAGLDRVEVHQWDCERNRVQLAKLLRSGGNLLLLDEPTNDLDVDTLRALEAGLESFPGCAVVVSHDRWFLDRIATHVLAFEGDSAVRWFEGNFTEYEEFRHREPGVAADQPHRIRHKGAGGLRYWDRWSMAE